MNGIYNPIVDFFPVDLGPAVDNSITLGLTSRRWAGGIFGPSGIDINPGSDIDADLITVGVTGTPQLYWDESQDTFNFNKGLWLNGGISSDGILTISAAVQVDIRQTSTSDTVPLSVTSVSSGADAFVDLKHYSASPADNDYFSIRFRYYNDAGTPEAITYGDLRVVSTDVSDGAEHSKFKMYLYNAGAQNQVLEVDGNGDLWLDGGITTGLDKKTYYGDTAVYIFSDDDGYLDLVADGGIRCGTSTLTNYRDVLENHTADDTLTTAETGSVHTNYGAGGMKALTLPASAAVGTRFTFKVAEANELRVVVGAVSESFIVNGATSTDDGGGDLYVSADDEGEELRIECIAAGVWLCAVIGTWSVTQP